MDIDLLELGLTKVQAEVYLALLEEPEQTGGELAKKLNLDRSFTYNILKSLARKGLVSYIVKNKKQVFYASDPENFIKELEEKMKMAVTIVAKLKSIKKKSTETRTTVYQGKQGLRTYLREILKAEEIHILDGGNYPKILDILKFDYPHYVKEMKSKKTKVKVITSQKNREILNNIFEDTAKIRTLENLTHNAGIIIINNKISFHSGKDRPTLTVIEDKNIVNTMSTYFNHLWQIAKE